MYQYQITKYNPKYLNRNGMLLMNDWTSMSDIGGIFNGKILDPLEYFITENMYIKAVKLIMGFHGIVRLNITGLELNRNETGFASSMKLYPDYYSDKMLEVFHKVTEGINADSDEIYELCRLNLREKLRCTLVSGDMDFVISFGTDYSMKIFCREIRKEIIDSIRDVGLFIEIISDQEKSEIYIYDKTESVPS